MLLPDVDTHALADQTFGPCGDPACPTGTPPAVGDTLTW